MTDYNWTEILPGAVFEASEWIDYGDSKIPTSHIDLKQKIEAGGYGRDFDRSHHGMIDIHGSEVVRDAIVEFLNSKDFGQRFKFHAGDRVKRVGSYSGPGEVLVAFKANGHSRYVVSHTIQGGEGPFLHIYGDKELEHA